MCHVLIIEDEPLVAMSIQDILSHEGAVSFDIVGTQHDAVIAAAGRKPDLITSDVKLLDGSGPAAVMEIHEQLGQIPVIFITGSPEACEPCNPPGSIVTKPFSAHALTTAFHHAGFD